MGGKKEKRKFTLRLKLISVFIATSLLISAINVFLYMNLRSTINEIDTVYVSNESLNELSGCLHKVEKRVYEYLSTKSSESLEDYYRYEQKYRSLLKELNREILDDTTALREKNIYYMSMSYLELTEKTIAAKRSRNVQSYKESYDEGAALYEKIDDLIWDLNNMQLQKNSERYKMFREMLNYLVLICAGVLVVVLLGNVFFILIMTRSITKPIAALSEAADKVAQGDFTTIVPYADTRDELGITARAFNKMVRSIRRYIRQTKENYERENRHIENEMRMKTELQEAQLKYLQAQINPHFLFNSLNAGAQLAMMEGAEITCLFVQNMADFFRYNVKKISTDTTLSEELELVDNYIYILNVRFAGEIHYEKQLDKKLLSTVIPSMILQPIVENAVNHGIRGIEREGHIWIRVYRDDDNVCVSVRDNGRGMEQETIRKILHGEPIHCEEEKDTTGIGMDNVISRMRNFFQREDIISIKSDGWDEGTEVILRIPFAHGMKREEEDV